MNREPAERSAADLTDLGLDARAVALGVTSGDSVAASAAAAFEAFGPEDFERILAVNLTGSYRCIRAFADAMIAAGQGAVVNISSVAGLQGVSGRTRVRSTAWSG